MKSFLSLFILLSFSVSAEVLDLVAFRSSPQGSFTQKFSFTSSGLIYSKQTNYFDTRIDYRLGTFKPKNPEQALIIRNELKKVLERLTTAASVLKKHDLEYNKLNPRPDHRPLIKLNEFDLFMDSRAYFYAEPVLKKLLALEWTLVNGVELNAKTQKVNQVKNERSVASILKEKYFSCSRKEGSSICISKNDESLYVD